MTDPSFENMQKSLALVRALRIGHELKVNKPLQHHLFKAFCRHSGIKQRPYASGDTRAENYQESDTPEELQRLLSQLIAKESPWVRLRPLALKVLSMAPSEKMAAWYCELCFLQAGVEEAAEAVRHYISWFSLDFYRQIHPRIREKVLSQLILKGCMAPLGSFLAQSSSEAWFRPLEKAVVFLWLGNEKRDEEAFSLFQNDHEEILKVSGQSATESFLPSAGGFLLRAARIGLSTGRADEAASLCKRIAPADPEYKEALILLNRSGKSGECFNRSDLRKDLLAAADQKERIEILKAFMIRTRQKGRDLTGDWINLNGLCKEIPRWFDASPRTLERLSYLFIEMYNLSELLDGYWSFFSSGSVKFLTEAQEIARWSPFVLAELPDTSELRYFRGLALLRLCIHGEYKALAQDEAVFQARELIQGALSGLSDSCRPDYPSWDAIWRTTVAYVGGSAALAPAKKEFLISLLQAAKSRCNMIAHDVEKYLKHPQAKPPVKALAQFLEEAGKQQSLDWELLTLMKMPGRFCCYTLSELNRIWYIAARQGLADLGWRCLSVVAARKKIPSILEKHHLLSGERRSSHPWKIPGARELDSCFLGFSPEQSRLVWACLKVGPRLPQLLSKTSSAVSIPGASRIKKVFERSSRAASILNGFRWLQNSPDYCAGGRMAADGTPIPAFCEALPGNFWTSLVCEISARMSPGAWRWRTRELCSMIRDVQPLRRHHWKPLPDQDEGPLNRWLKGLNSEQRNAFYDLSQVCARIDSEEGFYALAVFVCRLATVIYPDHYGALKSLQEMRAPAFVTWELEKWILSPGYTRIREASKTAHSVEIPPSLARHPVLGCSHGKDG